MVDNQITSLDPLVYLIHLSDLRSDGNPLQIQTIQVQRFLDRLNRVNRDSSIYHDKQNVHDITIQKTVCQSIHNLLKDPKPDFSVDNIINSALDIKTKNLLIEYCQDNCIHSIHLITYAELFGYVWNRIINSPYKEELFRILEEQISESECKCFTGRFNRTLSILVGFYDDIKIEISDQSRIGAIILVCKDKIIPYNTEEHRKLAYQELISIGYNESEIKLWLDAIDD